MEYWTISSISFALAFLAATGQGARNEMECDVSTATSCYWTAALTYGVNTLIPTAGHEEQYLSESHCPKPQQAPSAGECASRISTCSNETKAAFAEHEAAYESVREVISDHAKCQEFSQLRQCIKQDTMKNCSVHISLVPLSDSAEANLRASNNLRSCLEEALKPCNATYMTEPRRLARSIATSVGVLLRKPKTHEESFTPSTPAHGLGARNEMECDVSRATSCYWTAALTYSVHTLIPTAGHEEQYSSESHCPKPQQAPSAGECAWLISTCSNETKAAFAEHEAAYESVREVISDHAKCQEFSQLRQCIKQDTMKNCSVHISRVPLSDSAEANLRASNKLRSCLEEALKPCNATYMTEPKRLARSIATSVSVLLRKPKTHEESITPSTPAHGLGKNVHNVTVTSDHQTSSRKPETTTKKSYIGSQSTTVQPSERPPTDKPDNQSERGTEHTKTEPTSPPPHHNPQDGAAEKETKHTQAPVRTFNSSNEPEDAATQRKTEYTHAPQSGTRVARHNIEGLTDPTQSEDTSAEPSRTYNPAQNSEDASTATHSEPTPVPPSGVSATSTPAICALVSLAILSLANSFHACT